MIKNIKKTVIAGALALAMVGTAVPVTANAAGFSNFTIYKKNSAIYTYSSSQTKNGGGAYENKFSVTLHSTKTSYCVKLRSKQVNKDIYSGWVTFQAGEGVSTKTSSYIDTAAADKEYKLQAKLVSSSDSKDTIAGAWTP